MSKKHKHGRQNTHNDFNNAIRRQKSARYAKSSLEKRERQNSPMGNFDEADTELQEQTDISDKKRQRKKYEVTEKSGKPHNSITLENPEKAETVSGNENQEGLKDQLKKSAYAEKAKELRDHIESELNKALPVPNTEAPTETPTAEKSERTEDVSENNNLEKPLADLISGNDSKVRAVQTAIQRMKKAAYIRDKLIRENSVDIPVQEDDEPQETNDTDAEKSADEKADTNAAVQEDETVSGEFAETFSDDFGKEEYKRDFAQKQYTDRKKHSRKNNDRSSESIKKAVDLTSDVVSAVQSGNAAKMISMPIRYVLKDHMPDIQGMRTARMVSGAVKNSDGVGGAVTSVATTFAVDKAKQIVFRKFSGEPRTDRKGKKYRFISRKKKNGKGKSRFSKKLFTQKFAKERIKRKKQIQFFQKKNKDILPTNTKSAGKHIVKSKLSKKLIAFALPLFLPLFIVLILVIVVSSLFSWVSPYTYSLAGNENDDPNVEAESEADILDGYALMEQNFLDISQAYYYQNYGDWYGGTYDYPSAEDELSFAAFFSRKCDYIIRTIQAQFASALASAETPEEAAAIGRAMSEAISHALMQAQAEAENEYITLIESLDDCMTAKEERLHYEVKDSGGSNGIPDSIEFSGKPITDTNHFDQYEIQSDLSAEELTALTALYKTLLLVKTNGETEDGSEYNINITPEDIMTFAEKTKFIPITTEVTHNNACTDMNCKRRLVGDYESGYEWEYYCDSDHDNLNGQIGQSPSKDELIEKIMELTEAEENGFDKAQCEEMVEEYIKLICDDLEISESGFRYFGAADNSRAKEFYETLIDPFRGVISNNYWNVQTPIDGEQEEQEE